ncbi:hypothetical protein ANCCAN_15531 [Ancylostoma caninum]|uniref:Uncharacterized protein n=1 Tax=Ancylostoma caninum TaxID=29170 RepID=A0A368G6D2_ANCCA|nr:hypothetical protein ANCCAN_15531 [Ancylostoma caninum]
MLNEIQKAVMEIKSLRDTFERALFAFTEAVDNLKEPLSEEEEAKVSEYIMGAQELISQTASLLVKLEINKEQLASHRCVQTGLTETVHPSTNGNTVARIELPKLPIPEFSGKFWQWDSFWELFNATVHSLPLSDLQKFNYLLRALKGKARESIARFQVTSANYNLAVAHLKEGYGNAQNIITGLHRQLEYWTTRSTQLRDQRKLYDQISAISAQLESKGESLDSPWLLSKILSKFSEPIQRSTLKKEVSLPPNEMWTLQKLMTTLDFVIKQKEEIEQHLPSKKERAKLSQKGSKEAIFEMKKRSPFCFYCDSKDHWSTGCTKITAPKARLEHLKKNNRCI